MPDIMTLTFISGLVQAIPIIVAIVLGIFTYILLRSEVLTEISDTSKVLAATQTSITYAEIPFPLVAVIAHLYNLPLEQFQKLWMLENNQRCRKVVEVYKKDYLTTNFIEKFGSKYLRHGYVGCEALLNIGGGEIIRQSTISKRPAPPTREPAVDSSSLKDDLKSKRSASSRSASRRSRSRGNLSIKSNEPDKKSEGF